MAKKVTKAEMYRKILEAVADNSEMVDFINHEVELLEKKNNTGTNRKPTANQVANVQLADDIYAVMVAGTIYTGGQLAKMVPACVDFTPQKMTGLLKLLLADGKVDKHKEKNVTYWQVGTGIDHTAKVEK